LRPAKNVEAVPPSAEVLKADPDGDHRWSAKGKCNCVKAGLVKVAPPPKESKEAPTKYKERVMAWREKLEANSYEEYICAFVDPEDAYESGWAEQVGIDDRRLYYVRPDNGQEASDIVQALVESGVVDLLVVDSLANFTPREEIEEGAEKWQQGLQARILNKAIRGWVSMSAKNKNRNVFITQIWVNQKREKIGVLFGDPSVKPGGHGQDFAIHAEINFKASKVEAVSEKYGGEKEKNVFPVTEQIRFKVTKNRTAATKGVEGSFRQTMRATDAVPAGTVLEADWVLKQATKYLITEKSLSKSKKVYEVAGQEFPTMSALKDGITQGELGQVVREAILKELASAR
jgi:RecA/RadA recombinase